MITPNSNNKANNKACEGGRGVNPASHLLPVDSPDIRHALSLMYISNKKLYQYIREKHGIRVRHCWHLLLVASVNPQKPISFYIQLLNSSDTVMYKNLGYLVTLGYLRTEQKARMIIPLKRYTHDTVFVITTQGMTVINKLIGSL